MFAQRRSLLLLVFGLAACESPRVVPPPAALEVQPVRLEFPPTRVGQTREMGFRVRNPTAEVLPLTVSVAPASAGFTAVASSSLGPGASADVTVSFAPASPGRVTGRVEVVAGELPRVAVQVGGDGVAVSAPSLEPARLDFGRVLVGEVAVRTATVTLPAGAARLSVAELGATVGFCGREGPATPFCLRSPARPFGPDGSVASAGGPLLLEVLFRPATPGFEVSGRFTLSTCALAECSLPVELSGLGVGTPLDCRPAALELGVVGTATCAAGTIRCENLTQRQLALPSGARLSTRTSTEFSLGDRRRRAELQPGQTADFTITYCPSGPGHDEGSLELPTDLGDPSMATVEVPLSATGGSSGLALEPRRLDFGRVAVGSPARRVLRLTSVGPGALAILAVRADAPELSVAGSGTAVLQPGETRELSVDFAPAQSGAFASALWISTDAGQPEVRVPVTGQGVTLPPCAYVLSAGAELSFGAVERSRSLVRALRIENTGAGECLLTNVHLASASAPAFSLLDASPAGQGIPPGGSRTVAVLFTPEAVGPAAATLTLSISSPTAPVATVRLSGEGVERALLVTPADVDFGIVDSARSCTTPAHAIALYNTGTTAVAVTDIRLATPADPSFVLSGVPILTATVAPGESLGFEVAFRPGARAAYTGAVEVVTGTGAAARTQLVGLRGEGLPGGRQVDHFEQLGRPLVDVLWVIDNSGSMSQEQSSLAANFLSFIRFADAQGLDYHLAVTTTDVGTSGARGRFVPVNGSGPRIVTPETVPSPEEVFTRNARLGTSGSGNEQGLEAAYLALSHPNIDGPNAGFLRPDATLSLIFVTDEEDSSPRSVDFYVAFLLGIRGARNANAFSASAIAGGPSGCTGDGGSATAGLRYLEVAERTGGVAPSICTSDWARALEDVSTAAFGFKSRFFLTAPAASDTLEVVVDGVTVPSATAGGSVLWTFDPDANAVVFSPFATPEPGAQIDIGYEAVCRRAAVR